MPAITCANFAASMFDPARHVTWPQAGNATHGRLESDPSESEDAGRVAVGLATSPMRASSSLHIGTTGWDSSSGSSIQVRAASWSTQHLRCLRSVTCTRPGASGRDASPTHPPCLATGAVARPHRNVVHVPREDGSPGHVLRPLGTCVLPRS